MDTRDYYYDIEFIFIESRYFIENKDQKIDKLLNKPEEINIFIRDIVEENTLENMKKKNVMLFYKNIGKKDTNIIKLELYNNKLQENIENIIKFISNKYEDKKSIENSESNILSLKKPSQNIPIQIYIPLFDENIIEYRYHTDGKVIKVDKNKIFSKDLSDSLFKYYIRTTYTNKFSNFLKYSNELILQYRKEKDIKYIKYYQDLYKYTNDVSFRNSKQAEEDLHKCQIYRSINYLDKDLLDINVNNYYLIDGIKIKDNYLGNDIGNTNKEYKNKCIGKFHIIKGYNKLNYKFNLKLKALFDDTNGKDYITFNVYVKVYSGGLFMVCEIKPEILKSIEMIEKSTSSIIGKNKYFIYPFNFENNKIFTSFEINRRNYNTIFFFPKKTLIEEKDILNYSKKHEDIVDLFSDALKIKHFCNQLNKENKILSDSQIKKQIDTFIRVIFKKNSNFYFFKIKEKIQDKNYYKLELDEIQKIEKKNNQYKVNIVLNLFKKKDNVINCRKNRFYLLKTIKSLLSGGKSKKLRTYKNKKLRIYKNKRYTYKV